MWLSLCVHRAAHGLCKARASHCFGVLRVFECVKLKLVVIRYAQNPNMVNYCVFSVHGTSQRQHSIVSVTQK